MSYFSSTYWLVPVTVTQGACPSVDTLSLTASELIDLCAIEAEDVSKITYTEAQWIRYLNQAVRALVLARPESAMRVSSIQLTAGSRQILPSGYERVMAILRNMGADGVTPGSAIQGPKPMEHMDLLTPTWHTDTAGAEIVEYYYDPARAKVYYVNPPVPSTPALFVEAHLVYPPQAITDPAETVGVDSLYSVPLMEYMLYLAFARDHEATPNFTRSGAHLDRFLALLGLKESGELKITPQELESR